MQRFLGQKSIFLMVLLLAFACEEKSNENIRINTDNHGGSAEVPSPLSGAALYSKYCAQCHLKLSESQKKNKTVEDIEAALQSQARMQHLKGMFHPEDIKKISAALQLDVGEITGRLLYTNNCSGCHGSIETSEKKGVTVDTIVNAIASQSQMAHLSFLKRSDIEQIANALGENFQTTVTEIKHANVIDRTLLYNKLQKIFTLTTNPTEQSRIETILKENILANPSIFAGPCHRYQSQCGTSVRDTQTIINASADVVPVPNTVRRGTLINVCAQILGDQVTLNSWMHERNLDSTISPNANSIEELVKIFIPNLYPAEELKSTILDDLQNYEISSLNKKDVWQTVIFTFCSSPLMEVL